MDDVKHKMPMNKQIFFTNLENYLETPLYYFGSVKRYDYSPDNSDIDAILFTNNEASSISHLQNWFHASKSEFKKTVNYLPTSKQIAYGHKYTYKNKTQNISTDILIYNIKYEELLKKDTLSKINVPLYITIIWIILKFLHYQVGILSRLTYVYCKQITLDILDDGVYFWKHKTNSWKFFTFDIPKKKREHTALSLYSILNTLYIK
jgi:hypothetical protein